MTVFFLSHKLVFIFEMKKANKKETETENKKN